MAVKVRPLLKLLQLSPPQWKILASAFSNMSQAILLFASALVIAPEILNLNKDVPRSTGMGFLLGGIILLVIAVVISRKD